MNLGDIRTRIKRQFGDESGVQVTDDDITRWVNDGQRQIVMQNEGLLEKTATANSVDGQQEYTFPADILLLKGISLKYTGETSYSRFKGYRFTEFNEYVDGWDGTANEGRPIAYTIHANKIIVFPIPDASVTSAFKIYYTRTPVDVSLVSDTPDLPVIYHESLVKYCLQQAYKMDEDLEAANSEAAELASDISILRGREDWKQQETYSTITVLAEDLY